LRGYLWKLLGISVISISLFLILSSGSRQNLIALAISLSLIIYFGLNTKIFIKGIFVFFQKFIKYILILIGLGIILFKYEIVDPLMFSNRIAPFFFEGEVSSSDESRIQRVYVSIDRAFSNFGFGVGPGNQLHPEVHNGYIMLLEESGIIIGIICLLILSAIVMISIKRKSKSNMFNIFAAIFIVVVI